jgi:hypothetical protein
MLKEPITNVKPIGNGLAKSITDQCPISNGLLKSVTYRCRIGNELYSSYWRRMLVGCISFGCHAGSPFFSHQRHKLLSRLCLILSTPLALSPQKLGHSSSDNNTRSLSLSLSLQKVTRSICVLKCPRRPIPFTATSCACSEDSD